MKYRPSETPKVALVLGTRPEIIKMAPVIHELQARDADFFIIHSNQHYSADLDAVFFQELRLPEARYNLNVGSSTHANQTGTIMIRLEEVLVKEKPDVILAQGDTNTVLAAALTASKLGIKIGHIEAGLRSYDKTMPEETNRIVTDHISDLLFAVGPTQQKILISEGVSPDKIHVVGNTVVDAALRGAAIAPEESKILDELNLKKGEYLLATVHRAANVDTPERLGKVVRLLNAMCDSSKKQVVWPVHPRTKKSLEELGEILHPSLTITRPLGYFDFLTLLQSCQVVLTDSGGVQEEACILRVPCITLRENTERPETVAVGANVLVGSSVERTLAAYDRALTTERSWRNPFGDGTTARQIVDTLLGQSSKVHVERDEHVCVVGLGYMGLPMACLVASAGYNVTGVDVNPQRLEMLRRGECPFDEPGLREFVENALKSGRLQFSSKPVKSDIFIVAVPTNEKDHRIDLRHVESASRSVAEVVEDGNLVIIESTIKPGTCHSLAETVFKAVKKQVHLVHCPERAIPGNTMYEIQYNDRIIGGLTPWATKKAVDFYSSFIKGEIFASTARAAECAKLVENTFRDVNIALANEFDQIMSEHGVDIDEVITLANRHPRVNVLRPGPGVGGHCIAVDPWFLVEDAQSGEMVRLARKINDERPERLCRELLAKKKIGKKVGVLGISYKPDVDDARETPALKVVEFFEQQGYEVKCSDPYVTEWVRPISPQAEVMEWADTLLIVTEHGVYSKDEAFKRCLRVSKMLSYRGEVNESDPALKVASL